MADTFSNDLRLRLQESGSNAGTWGDLLNGTITNIASALGQGSEAIPNASTHTITLADGTADEARSLYLKCTGGGQACTVTLGPNTISKVWIIDNATSYTLTFSQGSGANVAIAAGAVKVIATDGAGSGAAVVDTLDGLEGSLSSLTVTGGLTANGGAVFNEASADVDFRVESDGNTHALFVEGSTGNVLVNTANAGASGLSLSNGSNLSFAEGANSSIANLFRQTSSADAFLGSGYRFSATSNKAESSYASSWARTAIGVGYGAIKFYADAAATVAVGTDITPTERMRIDSSGNVGIGTSSPAYNLDLTGVMRITGSRGTYIDASEDASSASHIFTTDASVGDFGQEGGHLVLQARTHTSVYRDIIFAGGINAASDLMRITGEGNVGIGTSSPNAVTNYTGLTLNNGTYGGFVDIENNGTHTFRLLSNTTASYIGTIEADPLVFNIANTERMRLDASGNLLVGTTSDTAKLSVYEAANNTEANPHIRITGAGYSGYHWLDATAYYIGQNSGARNLRLYSGAETAGVNLANGGTSFGTFSDERLKENIEPIENALESLSGLRTVKYHLKDVDAAEDKKKLGIIAQDLVGVIDEVIDPLTRTGDETEYLSVRYAELTPIVIKAIQEQQATIEAQATAITDLTTRLTALEKN